MGMFDGITEAISGVGDSITPGVGSVIGGVLSGGASLLGGNAANNKSWDIAMATNTSNAQEAQKNRDWQQQMSNTSYQRAVEDLQKAGLNPMLAYGQGGASTPSGAQSIAQQAQYHNVVTPAINSAMSGANLKLDLEQKDAAIVESMSRTQTNEQQAQNISADTKLKILEMPNVSQKLKNLVSEQLLNDARRTATSAEALTTQALLPKAYAEGDYYKKFGFGPYALRDLGQAAGSAASVFGALKGTSAVPLTTTTIKGK